MATDLSADTFLSALRRFSARSYTRVIIRYDATNFKIGSNLLQQIHADARVQEDLEYMGCEWKFIPPMAPWSGGFYERVVGTVKSCLRKFYLGKQ